MWSGNCKAVHICIVVDTGQDRCERNVSPPETRARPALTASDSVFACRVDCLYFTVQAGLQLHRTTLPTTPASATPIMDAPDNYQTTYI